MSAALTEDNSTTLVCTIFNKTKKDIVIGEEYSLQVLKGKSFVDVPLLPEAGAFDLLSRDILPGDEYITPAVKYRRFYLLKFPSAALSSIVVALATTHSSALQMKIYSA